MFLFRRRSWLGLLIGLPLVVWLAFFVIFPALGICRIYRVPTQSMSPTIKEGDYLLCSETAYKSAVPQRGDLVVMTMEGLSRVSDGGVHCKRVLGVPGDVLTVSNQIILRNGETLKDAEGKAYAITPGGILLQNDGDSLTVSEGFVFLAGDNSLNSSDGRMHGTTPLSKIRGEAVFLVWPVSRMGKL